MKDRIQQININSSVLHLLFISAISVVAYSNTFRAPFVFDDIPCITNNPVIKNLSNFLCGLTGYEYNPRRFIGFLSFAINYKFFGEEVVWFHAFNLFIHIANSALVYLLVVLTFDTPHIKDSSLYPHARGVAFFSAALFAAHPLNSQAVTYIVQRFTSLSTMFYVMSICLYSKARNHALSESTSNVKTFALISVGIITAILAMKTKEISFTLPFVIVLYEYFFFVGSTRKRFVYIAPYLVTLFIIPISVLNIQKPIADIIVDADTSLRFHTDITRWNYLITQFCVLVTYIRLLFIPVHQNLDYDYPTYDSFFAPRVLASFFILFAIFVVSIYLYWKSRDKDKKDLRLISFGILWFFIAVSVESSVIPFVDVIFEHRMYLPSIGLLISIVTAILIIIRKSNYASRKMFFIFGLVIVIIFTVSTYSRNRIWKDRVTLWEDVVRKSPMKVWPYTNLGNAYAAEKRYEQALHAYRYAISIKPDYAEAYNNIGIIYKDKNMMEEAIKQFRFAIQRKPDYAEAYNNLGVAMSSTGNDDLAIEYFKKAVLLQPKYKEAYFNLGNAYLHQDNRHDEAVTSYLKAIDIHPGYIDAYINLTAAYNVTGKYQDTIRTLRDVEQLTENNAYAHFNLGVAYLGIGNMDSARREIDILKKMDSGMALKLQKYMLGLPP